MMRKRGACPLKADDGSPATLKKKGGKAGVKEDDSKVNGTKAGGYLIGRHPECGTSPFPQQYSQI